MPDHVKPITWQSLREAGVEVSRSFQAYMWAGNDIRPIDIKTHPYPGFPTDMQAQMTTLMTKANGTSMVIETILKTGLCTWQSLKEWVPMLKLKEEVQLLKASQTYRRNGSGYRFEGRCGTYSGRAYS